MTARMPTIFAVASILAAACAPATTAQAGDRFELDPGHTHVQFSVRRFGFNDVIATMPDVSGIITLDQEAPENSSVEVEIGVASIASGNATREQALMTPFWFNVEEFPKITYRSLSVERIGDDQADVTGELTILGVTKPIVMRVVFNKIGNDPATKREAVGFSATASLKRSDFGMMTAANFVGDDVEIRIETLAHKIE